MLESKAVNGYAEVFEECEANQRTFAVGGSIGPSSEFVLEGLHFLALHEYRILADAVERRRNFHHATPRIRFRE